MKARSVAHAAMLPTTCATAPMDQLVDADQACEDCEADMHLCIPSSHASGHEAPVHSGSGTHMAQAPAASGSGTNVAPAVSGAGTVRAPRLRRKEK